MYRKWMLRALVVLALWLVVCVTVGVANATMVPHLFKWDEYILASVVSTAVLIIVGAATLGALELIRRIK